MEDLRRRHVTWQRIHHVLCTADVKVCDVIISDVVINWCFVGKLKCPRDDVMPILKKFGRDCGKSFDECDVIKNDCVNENDVCCKTECGLKCVVGQIE